VLALPFLQLRNLTPFFSQVPGQIRCLLLAVEARVLNVHEARQPYGDDNNEMRNPLAGQTSDPQELPVTPLGKKSLRRIFNMNCKKISVLAFALVGVLLLASVANAAPPVVFLGVGSSAQFPTAGIAAVSPDPVTGGSAPCGSHLWSGKNGKLGATILGVDPRATGTPAIPPLEPGNIWVAWDNSTTPTVVCAYLVVDSVVGNRLYFAQGAGGDWFGTGSTGNGTLHFITGTSQGNVIAGFPDTDLSVPCVVAQAIDSNSADTCKASSPVGFNVAMTDIRPEDAQYANGRASQTFGYNTGATVCGPNPFLSSYSATNAQVCAFNVNTFGGTVTVTDPSSGLNVPAAQTYTFGAAPIIIFGNNNSTGMGGAGCTYPTNINSKSATKLWAGYVGTSQQAFGPGVCNAQLSVNQREATSGTYNTFEFQVVHARDGNSSDTQENNGVAMTQIVGNPPSGHCPTPPAAFTSPYTCTNPLVLSSGQNSVKLRAIGTGEMVNAVNGTVTDLPPYSDRLGYAFYSLGSFFSSANAHVQYFTLQGVDGLYANYNTNGLFGFCAGSIPAGTYNCSTPLPSYPHIQDGTYRVWSQYRWIAAPGINTAAAGTTGALIYGVLTAGGDQAHYALANPSLSGISCNGTGLSTYTGPCFIKAIADFVAPQDLKVFRSHYPLSVVGPSGIDANNGTNSPSTGFCAADQSSPNCIEEGGDMAGVVFFVITDQQLFGQTGNEALTNIE
jgi:hypothetical protein